jgi:hypothetical protein
MPQAGRWYGGDRNGEFRTVQAIFFAYSYGLPVGVSSRFGRK